jgi:hypothetical protein
MLLGGVPAVARHRASACASAIMLHVSSASCRAQSAARHTIPRRALASTCPSRSPFLPAQTLPLSPTTSMASRRHRSNTAQPSTSRERSPTESQNSVTVDTHAHHPHQHTHGHEHKQSSGHSHSIFSLHAHTHDAGVGAEKIIAALQGKGWLQARFHLIIHLLIVVNSSICSGCLGDRGSQITLIGLGANIVLTIGKGAAGWMMHSASLVAEAAHSLSGM